MVRFVAAHRSLQDQPSIEEGRFMLNGLKPAHFIHLDVIDLAMVRPGCCALPVAPCHASTVGHGLAALARSSSL